MAVTWPRQLSSEAACPPRRHAGIAKELHLCTHNVFLWCCWIVCCWLLMFVDVVYVVVLALVIVLVLVIFIVIILVLHHVLFLLLSLFSLLLFLLLFFCSLCCSSCCCCCCCCCCCWWCGKQIAFGYWLSIWKSMTEQMVTNDDYIDGKFWRWNDMFNNQKGDKPVLCLKHRWLWSLMCQRRWWRKLCGICAWESSKLLKSEGQLCRVLKDPIGIYLN